MNDQRFIPWKYLIMASALTPTKHVFSTNDRWSPSITNYAELDLYIPRRKGMLKEAILYFQLRVWRIDNHSHLVTSGWIINSGGLLKRRRGQLCGSALVVLEWHGKGTAGKDIFILYWCKKTIKKRMSGNLTT